MCKMCTSHTPFSISISYTQQCYSQITMKGKKDSCGYRTTWQALIDLFLCVLTVILPGLKKIFFPMDKYEDHGLYPTVIEKMQWLVQQDP